MKKLEKLQSELSKEWKKPKAQNITEEHDKREARSYKKIKELQQKINECKQSK